MAKTRSPSYPSIGLKEAVEKVHAVYTRDYQNPIPRAVAAEHMGYQSLNGKSLGVLAALGKFGLLEGRGDDTRVSDLALTIIAHPPGASERAAALRTASARPELFAELDTRFQGGKASDQAIRSYLLTQRFIPAAADTVVRSYRETKQLVEAESAGYSPPDEASAIEDAIVEHQQQAARGPEPKPIPSAGPYRLTMSPDTLEVSASLNNLTDVDALIRALNAWKILLRPADEVTKPEASKPDIMS